MVKCAKNRCPSDFPQTFYVVRGVSKPHKTCPKCRAGMKRYLESDKGKKAKQKYLKSDARKAQQKRQNQSEAHKESLAKWSKSERGRATQQAGRERYYATENGSQVIKRRNARAHKRKMSNPGLKLFSAIQSTMCMMTTGVAQTSKKVWKATGFASHKDLLDHFASTFEKGMTTENHGAGPGKWNIGHRIAKAHYDASNEEDARRCWSRENLFAQWALENQQAGIALPPTEVLLQLKPFWPVAWQGCVPNKEMV